MSNLSRTPPADRRSVEQDRDAEIGGIFNALVDETRQLVLDSEEIAATRMHFLYSRVFPRSFNGNDRQEVIR